MTYVLQNENTIARFAGGGGVLHVRFGGHSFDISLPGLDISPSSSDVQVKRAVAGFLDVPTYRLDDYVVDRHPNGNVTIRKSAQESVHRPDAEDAQKN